MSGFDINQLTITGNLTAEPELRNLPSGTAVTKIRIAHNDRRKTSTGDWTDVPGFYDVTIWSGMAEYAARQLSKGDKVVIAGRLQWREWETDDGAKRQSVDIVANSVVPVPRNGAATEPPKDFEPDSSGEDIPF
jgi:single-strand DNA-binding protein